MSKYIIEGGKRLVGSVKISGNKNAALPCIAAALLTEDDVILKNVPRVSDVFIQVKILTQLGVNVDYQDHKLTISAKKLSSSYLPKDLTTRLRGSIVLVGALLARLGRVSFSHPGGDVIGKRAIDIHIQGLEALGYEFEIGDRHFEGYKKKIWKNTQQVFLEEASVTATENLILASVLSDTEVVIKNCATEPHIVDLCEMLSQMGANIKGIKTSTLEIIGVEKLIGVEFTLGPEHIEIGTYAIAAAVTKGRIKLTNCSLQDLEPIVLPLQKMGVRWEEIEGGVVVSAKKLQATSKLHTNIWPGLPTDLMSALIVLATQAQGVSLLHDWMYESRMFFVDKLISMGANITIADPHRVLVYGPTTFLARDLETPDIRAGMALVLASLIAKGVSTINRAELIERGYEDVVGKLSKLGARIRKIE